MWREIFGSSGVLLMVLLQLGVGLDSAAAAAAASLELNSDFDYEVRDDCDMQYSWKSPYVQAYTLHPPTSPLQDCPSLFSPVPPSVSRNRRRSELPFSSNPPRGEARAVVHVVSLEGEGRASRRGSVVGGSNSRAVRRVQLVIRHEDNVTESRFSTSAAAAAERELVFVLYSPLHPIVWEVKSQGISTKQRCTFWVSNGSRVLRTPLLNMTSRRLQVQQASEAALTRWVQRRFGSAPVMTERVSASVNSVTLGMGSAAPVPCGAPTPPVEQTTNGCVARWNEGFNNKDVHVLELLSSGAVIRDSRSTAPERLTVALDIHPRGRPALRKHILLVLKSNAPTLWKVRTRGLRGTLGFITDHEVDTASIDLQSVQVVNEGLSSLTGLGLVHWTADKYGRPVSYTQVNLSSVNWPVVNSSRVSLPRGSLSDDRAACRIDVIVDGGEYLPHANPRWQQQQQQQQRQQQQQPRQQLSVFNDDVTMERDPLGPERESLVSGDAERMEAVAQARSVSCQRHQMIVSLWKNSLQRYNVHKADLSVRKRECRTHENSTHYFWMLPAGQCGTTLHRYAHHIAHNNAILVTRRRISGRRQNAEEDESSGSGLYQDITLLDDEDLGRVVSSDQLAQPFSCDYSIATGEPMNETPSLQYQLKVYSDHSFHREIILSPVTVSQMAILYVEISIASESQRADLGVYIKECSLQPVEGSSLPVIQLFNNGCPVDNRARLTGSGDEGRQRFEFQADQFWDRVVTLVLTCQVDTCIQAGHFMPDMPRCRSQAEVCAETRGSWTGDQTRSAMPTKSVGPVIITLAGPQRTLTDLKGAIELGQMGAQRGEGGEGVSTPMTSCEQVIHVEGLNSPTVVGIAFTAFLIGAALTGAIWYIHACTVPAKKRMRSLRLADTSGESTPSSTGPITIRQTNQRV